jgi:hypothetical protein
MLNTKSILIMSLMVSIGYGCVQKQYAKIETPTDNSTVETTPARQWDPVRREFWTVMLFTQLSNMPQIRVRFAPKYLHGMVRCAIDEYERRYDIEYFEKVFGVSAGKLSPDNGKIAYDITFECSEKQMKIQQEDFQKKAMEEPDLKDMI